VNQPCLLFAQVLKRHSVCNYIWELIQSSPANEEKENENKDGQDGQEQKEKDAHNFLSQAVKARLTIEYQRLNPEEILKGQEAGIFNANFEFKDVQVGQRVLIKYNFYHIN
jgi:hypothetical protein